MGITLGYQTTNQCCQVKRGLSQMLRILMGGSNLVESSVSSGVESKFKKHRVKKTHTLIN